MCSIGISTDARKEPKYIPRPKSAVDKILVSAVCYGHGSVNRFSELNEVNRIQLIQTHAKSTLVAFFSVFAINSNQANGERKTKRNFDVSGCCQSSCQLSAIIYCWNADKSNFKIGFFFAASLWMSDSSFWLLLFLVSRWWMNVFRFAELVHALDWRSCILHLTVNYFIICFYRTKIKHFWINTFLMNVTLAAKNWTYTELGIFYLFFLTRVFWTPQNNFFNFFHKGALWEGRWRVDGILFLQASCTDWTGVNRWLKQLRLIVSIFIIPFKE